MSFSRPDDLIGKITKAKAGFAVSNRYKVFINSPMILRNRLKMDELNLLCNSVTLPGKALTTVDHVTYRQPQKLVNGYQLEDVNFEFYLTNDYGVKKYFDEWQSSVLNPSNYLINYSDTYTSQVQIYQSDPGDNNIYGIKLLEAYPINVQEIQLGNENENGIVKLSVTMSYFDYEVIDVSGPGNYKVPEMPEFKNTFVNQNSFSPNTPQPSAPFSPGKNSDPFDFNLE